MPFVSKPIRAPRRKRLTLALAVITLCALTSACSNDDPPASTTTLGSTGHFTANPGDPSNAPPPPDSAPPTLTVQTPAAPASEAATVISATSPPLASPVIHSVD